MQFTVDKPEAAFTPRAWIHLTSGHPDGERIREYTCVGNWLDYPERGIHAVAYLQRHDGHYVRDVNLGEAWFASDAEQQATDWIIGQVSRHLGQPLLV